MPDMDSCEELLEAQDTALTLIQRILVNFNKLPRAKKTAVAVRNRIESLKAHWDTCQQQHAKLCALIDEGTRRQHEFIKDKFLLISDTVEEIMDILSENLERLQPSIVQPNLDVSNSFDETRIAAVHLPRIDIPKFSEEITKWENFRDIFESLVASRADLLNVQKLHYLKANLTGEASLILTNTQITDANYATAWELLKKNYDKPRAIVNAHLQTFVDLPSVNSHSLGDLKILRDKSNDIYTALLNLKRPVEQWEDLMIFIIVSKLDKTTRHDWELTLGDDVEIPSFAKLDGFLTSRIRALEAINPSCLINKPEAKNGKAGNVKSHQVSVNQGTCAGCKGNQPLHQCKSFIKLAVRQCIDLLKQNKCCFNCLHKGHFPRECKSKNVCTLCKQKHHSLIHRDQSAVKSDPSTSPSTSHKQSCNPSIISTGESELVSGESIASNNFSHQSIKSTLLPTAMVLLRSSTGRSVGVRALLDQGSQATFVSESVAQLIKADREPVSIAVSGVGGNQAGTVKTVAKFSVELCSRMGPVLPIKALVMSKLTAYVPLPVPVDTKSELLENLILADPEPSGRKKVDLLIGADYFGSILLEGLIRGVSGGPTAQRTIFGWVISGPVTSIPQNASNYRINVNHVSATDPLHDSIHRFRELEEIPLQPLLSEEEAQCEAHFINTHSRQSDGRYIVRLPFKTAPPIPIGETEHVVKRIFLSNENRLARQPVLAKTYREFIHEYETIIWRELTVTRSPHLRLFIYPITRP
ncbi:unnamed protein product [Lasius platythorax]|uniref:CCHC-type domain-containing protein n=1 Tax=Lasius platythorax TaxID=488582 RepID=A0AAV2MYC5_9HYME